MILFPIILFICTDCFIHQRVLKFTGNSFHLPSLVNSLKKNESDEILHGLIFFTKIIISTRVCAGPFFPVHACDKHV